MDTADLRAAATRLVGQGSVNPLSPLYFAGFDRVTPAMQRLVDALRTAGSDVEMVAIADRSSDIRCFSLPNPNAEFRAAGAWARKLLEQNPQQRIAIVCTDLQNDVMTAGHSVRDGFVPGWYYQRQQQLESSRCLRRTRGLIGGNGAPSPTGISEDG